MLFLFIPSKHNFPLIKLLIVISLVVIVLSACRNSKSGSPAGTITGSQGAIGSSQRVTVSPTLTSVPLDDETSGEGLTCTLSKYADMDTTVSENTQQQPGTDTLKDSQRLAPSDWKEWPVVPEISDHAKAIFAAGVAAGNDLHHFSVLGDCQAPEWKLFGVLDWESYELAEEYSYLQPTVDYYQGQWSRRTFTVVSGNTVSTIFSVYWADANACQPNETQIECEFRINNPNLVVLMLGTNWNSGAEQFESELRKAVDYLLARHILPVLVTKGDSHGPDWPLNQAIVRVAYDYDLPLWNFWLAIQDMPNHGMKADDPRHIHIDPQAYTLKRITGLQTLDAVLQAVYTE
jgi:hypothetical protein